MAARVERAFGINGGRVLTLEAGGVDAPALEAVERRVRTGVVLVGTAGTIRQVAGGLNGVDGVVVAGAVKVQSSKVQSSNEEAEGGVGVNVLGGVEDLPLLVGRFGIKMAVVCLPRAMDAERRRVGRVLSGLGIAVRWVEAMEDVLEGVEVSKCQGVDGEEGIQAKRESKQQFVGAAPAIDLASLIGRKPYEMDRDAIAAVLRGRCVLITGAGGSIGSELAKVAASFEPSMLVLMERSENALFEIDRQIGRHFPGIQRRPVLHDVVDAEATLRLCERVRPQVVFHAAAHKHVPLMEDHPAHAVTNNLFGTKSIADAAASVGAERFVMISSDKAVNPTSVMGATKRLAEMYVRWKGSAECRVQSAEGECGTRLSMVRFGNVLGSNASVLTIWAQQIAEGGPLTITDPRMTRYFMTIPEAATLVVQSTTLDAGGSGVGVYVLDMGEPVRIVELAERFVRAHGFEARVVGQSEAGAEEHYLAQSGKAVARGGTARTIDLVFTGIRPGEKLHEELAYAAEQLRATAHPGVRAWAGPGFGEDVASRVREMVREMGEVRFSQDPARVVEAIRRHVPEMRAGPSTANTGQNGSTPATQPRVG